MEPALKVGSCLNIGFVAESLLASLKETIIKIEEQAFCGKARHNPDCEAKLFMMHENSLTFLATMTMSLWRAERKIH